MSFQRMNDDNEILSKKDDSDDEKVLIRVFVGVWVVGVVAAIAVVGGICWAVWRVVEWLVTK